ncbi:MAG: PadR family transcriptional regulator [Caulobacteraceae bacterium]|jgi:DNA-binding PadR family transcriptional regulator
MFHDHFHHHQGRFAIGRRGGRHHWGRGGGSPWGFGDGGIPGGRKLSSGDLQLVILALLEARPAHGYELIRAVEERSRGFYAPSPGVIYPALTYLEEVGYAAVAPEGHRKLYSLTDVGRAHLEANRLAAEAILDALTRIGGRMDEVRDAFAGFDDLDPRASDDLHSARHALKHALARKRGCSPDEARRIVDILNRATAEILGRNPKT